MTSVLMDELAGGAAARGATDELGSKDLGSLCDGDTDSPLPATERYALLGPQVEPAAAFWLQGGALPGVVPLDKILEQFRDASGAWLPDVLFPTDDGGPNSTIQTEIKELETLATTRHRNLNSIKADYLSDFINLQKPPFGAVVDTRTQYALTNVNEQHLRINLPELQVNTGGQLARMFENETPGLLHRHALDWLLYRRADISPVRHARIWMALDVTIYSALSAAWYFKWAAGDGVSFRLRPYEYDRGQRFAVLYDKVVPNDGVDAYGAKGESLQGMPRTCPLPSPGTPRHPAYPSGHSTFSAAASRILEYFFSPDTLNDDDAAVDKQVPADPAERIRSSAWVAQQLRRLADNIGEARLWGGVHWRSDHTFGQRVGRATADLLIEQLRSDCVERLEASTCPDNRCDKPVEPTTRPTPPCPDAKNMDQIPFGPRPRLLSTGTF